MLYFALLRHQWKSFARSFKGKRLWINALVLAPIAIYAIVVLVFMGLYFDKVLALSSKGVPAVSWLNKELLSLFFGMLALRFFFQRSPRMELPPYLHLPIPRRKLLIYHQVASLLTVHNFYPLLFFVPFWIRFFVLGPYSVGASVFWLSGFFLFLLMSHYVNTWIRIFIDRHIKQFLVLVGLLLVIQISDQIVGSNIFSTLSTLVFDGLANENIWILLTLALLTFLSVYASSSALFRRLKTDIATKTGQKALPEVLTFRNSPLRNLVLLELLLMWRNKRSKQYVIISVGVSTAYTALLLSDYNALFGPFMAAVIGLFASGVFALNYGQLMFAWESRYFDGLLARDIRPDQMVLAKFMVLQGSCLVLFLVSLPLFLWLAPRLLLLHVAFLFYNAGVTSMLMLALAVLNRKRVNAAEGSFFNYQGFSILHWLWIIPTIIPPVTFFYLLEGSPETALSIIALVGLVSMLLAWPWSRLLARYLNRRKYIMALGFRSYDR